MASFEPTPITRRASVACGRTLWRHPTIFRLKAAPASIEFNPVTPYDFAVASSLQVDVFSTETNAVYRTLSRFKDTVRCASYRHDGRILAASDECGNTQIFDVAARSIMRTFAGHTKAVHVVRFGADGARVITASDDTTCAYWDVAVEAKLGTLEGHADFVRSGTISPASPHVFATGSYDHSVKLWDVRGPRCIMTLKHAAPVEHLVMLPGGGMLASASGATLTVWDILTGRILHAISAHSKTITGLARDATATHLLSASLDRTVKAYELTSGRVRRRLYLPGRPCGVACMAMAREVSEVCATCIVTLMCGRLLGRSSTMRHCYASLSRPQARTSSLGRATAPLLSDGASSPALALLKKASPVCGTRSH